MPEKLVKCPACNSGYMEDGQTCPECCGEGTLPEDLADDYMIEMLEIQENSSVQNGAP